MHETEAERRLRLLGGGEYYWYDMDRIMTVYGQISEEMTNPCMEMDIVISLPQVHRCPLGSNPLVKFTKYKFKF